MKPYRVFLRLEGRRALVVGGGKVVAAKLPAFSGLPWSRWVHASSSTQAMSVVMLIRRWILDPDRDHELSCPSEARGAFVKRASSAM
jgi:siroheme synthase (precorrin-2 oxidase/ferrochelatase)